MRDLKAKLREMAGQCKKVRWQGDSKFDACCPAHGDSNPSFSATIAPDDSSILACCHAGCSFKSIVEALGMKPQDLYRDEPEKSVRSNRGSSKKPVATYDYTDEGGQLLYQVMRFEPKDFRQRRLVVAGTPSAKNEDGLWWLNKAPEAKDRVLYRLPAVRSAVDASKPVYFVEGEKDADSLFHKGLVATTMVMGANKPWLPQYTKQLRDADVIIIPDNDKPSNQHVGQRHAANVARILEEAGICRSVRVLTLPEEHQGHQVKDATDFLNAGGTVEELQELAKDAEPGSQYASKWPASRETPTPSTESDLVDSDRPIIHLPGGSITNHDSLESAHRALVRINKTRSVPLLVKYGGQLCEVHETSLQPLMAITWKRLWAILSEHCELLDEDWKGNIRHARVNRDFAEVIMASPGILPEVDLVLHAPMLTPAGDWIVQPGYYSEVKALYVGMPYDAPLAKPTSLDVHTAVEHVTDLMCDFPFSDESGRAHAMAAMVQPLVRLIINGPTPLYLVEASTNGAGKTLLAKTIASTAASQEPGVMTWARDQGETRKSITTALLQSPPCIIIDNINCKLDSPDLAAAITTSVWQGRELGKNTLLTLPNSCLWIATMNNPESSREMARRSVTIRLEPTQDHPEDRTGFRHQLPAHAYKSRDMTLRACMVLVQHWVNMGRPKGAVPLGSFESWSEVIGGILSACGFGEGFLGDRQRVREFSDTETSSMTLFVDAWFERFGCGAVTAADLVDRLPPEVQPLSAKPGDSDSGRSKRLGRLLMKSRGSVHSGNKIEVLQSKATGRKTQYALVPVKPVKSDPGLDTFQSLDTFSAEPEPKVSSVSTSAGAGPDTLDTLDTFFETPSSITRECTCDGASHERHLTDHPEPWVETATPAPVPAEGMPAEQVPAEQVPAEQVAGNEYRERMRRTIAELVRQP